MTAAEYLARVDAAAVAATEGPWEFGIAPADGSDETKAEWMAGSLADEGPLYALWVPATVGQPGGFIVPAVTGDGPNAGNNAEFIALSRDAVPRMAAALRAVLALHERPNVPYCSDSHHDANLCPCADYYCPRDGDPYPCPTVRAITAALDGAP